MSPSTIIREAAADGVDLVVSPAGGIKARGGAVTLWKPIIRDNKRGIVAALREAANEPALTTQLQQLIRKVGAFRRFTPAELEETLAIASRDPDHALVSFRLLATEVDAVVDIDREGFEERAGILEYDGGYSRPEAELLAAWEATQALFARLTEREWLARYAPERLPAGDQSENYPAAQIAPGNTFWMERARRGGRR